LRRGGHIAVHVIARARLESLELRAQVLALLAGEPRDMLLALERRAMARDAMVLFGQAPSRGGAAGIEQHRGKDVALVVQRDAADEVVR